MSTAPPQELTLDDAAWERMMQATNGAANVCFQCGTCTATCPWNLVRDEPFSVRQALRAAQLGLALPEGVWLCTTCAACEPRCPRGVPVSQVIQALRYLGWQDRKTPAGIPSVLWSVYWDNNPYHRPPSEKGKLARDLRMPVFDASKHEILFYTGCTGFFDRRAQKVARALLSLFEAASVRFGSLAENEPCCGETAFALGHKDYFNELAQTNLKLFQDRGVSTLVTLSPHCWDVFKNHYPAPSDQFRPLHYTQYLAELAQAGRLRLPGQYPRRVAFHDPCYLGRRNGEYDAPRALLSQVAGLELVEFADHRETGLCCGGGGGRMFLETAPKERFSNLRAREAMELNVEVIAAACPFCITCLEDSLKQAGPAGRGLRVLDVAEILADGASAAPAAVAQGQPAQEVQP